MDVRLIDATDQERVVRDAYPVSALRPRRIVRDGIAFDAVGPDASGVWMYRSVLTFASAPRAHGGSPAQFVLAPAGVEAERFTVTLADGVPPTAVDRNGVRCPLWGSLHGVYQYFVPEGIDG